MPSSVCYTLRHSSRISNWNTSLARLQVINPSNSYTGKMLHNLRLQSLRNLENLRPRGPSAMAKASKGAMGPRKSKQKTSSAETAWPKSVAGLTERTCWRKNIWYANRKETETGFLESLEIFPNIRKIVF